MSFPSQRVGDLYQPDHGTFIFNEIIEYKGELCFRSLGQSPPFWPIHTYRPEDMKYLGNGQDDGALRQRCECLTKVNFCLMYGQQGIIPRTPEYYKAIKEWETLAPQAKEVLVRRAYERQKRWLKLQNLKDWKD